MPQTKTNRSNIEKIKYRAVKNYYGSTELAKKARSWSNDTILRELGIKVPSRLPNVKTPSERAVKQRFNQLERYKLAQQEHTVEEALKLRRYAKKYIVSSNEYQQTLKTPMPPVRELSRRKELWTKWSLSHSLPPFLKKESQRVNCENVNPVTNRKYGRNEHFGYTAVFYAYTRQEDLTKIKNSLIPSKDYNDSPRIGRLTRRR